MDPQLSGDLIAILSTASGPTILAIVVVVLWRRLQAVERQRDALQQAVLDKVIPAVTEANLTMRQIAQLIQTDVSFRDRRSE